MSQTKTKQLMGKPMGNHMNKQEKSPAPKDIRQILVKLIKSQEGQKIIDDLVAQIPDLAVLKYKGK